MDRYDGSGAILVNQNAQAVVEPPLGEREREEIGL
jgi:hypothetical protein